MDTKLFCVMEQGKYVNEPLTLKHKEQFNTSFSDFYRLNWSTDTDPNATISATNLTLSEGKNLLYLSVPKIYQYYIFIDDDVNLETVDGSNVAEKLRELLLEYRPLHATCYRASTWGSWHVAHVAKTHAQKNRDAWPIYGFDLDCDIYHWSYIQAVFPIRYQGCYKCLGYAQYICYKLHPEKQMIFNQIRVTNTRQDNHQGELGLPQAFNGDQITKLFLKDLTKHPLNTDAERILNNAYVIPVINNQIYDGVVSKEEIIFDKAELKTICNWV